MGDEPGHLVVEVAGMARNVACPRDLRDRRPMLGAVDPRGVCLEDALERSEIEAAPPSPALPPVIARGTHAAASTATPGALAQAHMDDHRRIVVLDLHVLDHDVPVDTDDPAPHVGPEQRRSPSPLLWTFEQPRS